MARFTEEEKMLRRIDKRFSKGVVEYGLIEDGDKILIGLSGGKDSLALVELLARRARVYKPRFSVVAVHVVMKNIPYQSDVDYLREYVESWGVPFVLFETEFDATTDTRKSPCFLCSWNNFTPFLFYLIFHLIDETLRRLERRNKVFRNFNRYIFRNITSGFLSSLFHYKTSKTPNP